MEEGITIALENREHLQGICGANDENLKILEKALCGYITARGNEIHFKNQIHPQDASHMTLLPDVHANPNDANTGNFKKIIENLINLINEGDMPTAEYIRTLVNEIKNTDNFEKTEIDLHDSVIQIPQGLHRVHPRSRNQALYIKAMRENEICFCIGPAGTGKTYLAIAHALNMILSKKIRKLVLTRPVVEAGENLGFLPGDLAQKIDPYLRPLYDAMESLISFDVLRRLEETRAIEIAPLAYMRGRSLNDCIIILDEAQNTTKEQMKMFLTRIGNGSRAVITGDTTQIDLGKKTESGLLHAIEILKGIEGLNFSFLHTADVARNPLVKKIIDAYDNKRNIQ